MKPSDYYQQDVKSGAVLEDAAQEQVLTYFDALYAKLTPKAVINNSWWKKLFSAPPATALSHTKGIYLWGSVGRGKTYLMDIFYKSLDVPKLRQHFYEFMARVHAELKLHQGKAEPLKLVAADIAKQAQVLCLDEFFVEDIADAMILSGLLYYLFENKVIIVTTSNVIPNELYEDGLQRDRFLPAITMINKELEVIHLQHPQDYRLIKELCDHRYHSPLQDSVAFLQAQFNFLNHDPKSLPLHFQINQRGIQAVRRSGDIVWFDFRELCEDARSSIDYLQLCADYKVVLVGNVPALTIELEDAARRFIALVDTCYDQGVLLILAAAVPLSDLYQGKHLIFEFERVRSRIIEMQSWTV